MTCVHMLNITYDSIITLKLLNIIHHSEKTPSAPLSSLSPLPTLPASCSPMWHPVICFLSLHVSLHFLGFCAIVLHSSLFLLFFIWCLRWAIILGFFHTVACIKNPFLLLLNTISFMDIIYLVFPFTYGWTLGWQFGAVTNTAVMNICIKSFYRHIL